MSRKHITSLAVVGVIALFAFAVPWALDREATSLDRPNAEEFPGSYATLANGHTRYRLQGPAEGETVVLVGGLTTSLEFFDALALDLNNAGYRTLQFDLFGRGGSARPYDQPYDQQTFVTQIDNLLDELGINEKVHVVGQSLGGGISVAWAAQSPAAIRSLSIHASAGYLEELPSAAGLLTTPLLGDYVWWWIGNDFIGGNTARYFAKPEQNAAAIAALELQFAKAEAYHGYRHSVLSTIRNFGANDMRDVFSKLNADDTPVQIIWGTQDVVIPIGNASTLMEWIAGTPDFVALDGVGHMPLLEDPSGVHQLVLDHLRAN